MLLIDAEHRQTKRQTLPNLCARSPLMGVDLGLSRFLGDYMSSTPTADEQEHRRLSNALEHLKRSNRELAEALEDGPDPTYVEAIQENTEVSNNWICAIGSSIPPVRAGAGKRLTH